MAPITDIALRKAKPQDKPYKIAAGSGLYLLVNPIGSKLWRWKYRVAGKEKLLALGAYPTLSLQDARQRCEDARRRLALSEDPAETRKAQKTALAMIGISQAMSGKSQSISSLRFNASRESRTFNSFQCSLEPISYGSG